MKRMIVTPFEWGTTSGYDFLNNDNPEADIVNEAHISYADLHTVFERSYRIWEPGRMALSSLGVVDPSPDQQFNVPQIPQGCKIHGIKGTMLITPQKVATFYNADTGEVLPVQPTYDEVFAPAGQAYWYADNVGTWIAPTNTLYPSGFSTTQYPWNEFFIRTPVLNDNDPQQFCRYPLYITMYKGTFNPYGGNFTEGGSIDSGPSDDPDTLLGIDITNPTVLEQERIVWWDMEMCTAAHRSREDKTLEHRQTDGTSMIWYHGVKTYTRHVTKYNLSLDRNFILKDDQVLWLHVQPGIVRTPLFWLDPEGNIVPLAYTVGANIELVASMLVTPFTPGV